MPRGPLAAVLLAAVLLLSACTSETRDNELRPPIPANVIVNVSEREVSVSPTRVGYEAPRRQQVIENSPSEELISDPGTPMPVQLTIANTLNREVRVRVRGPGGQAATAVTANGTGSVTTNLTSGDYRITAAAGTDARPGRLRVGPRRVSPQNDLLIP